MQKSQLYGLYMKVIDKVKRSLTTDQSMELGDPAQKMQLINELEKVHIIHQIHKPKNSNG